MTTLYRPVPITSAEQAEALPIRTPVLMGPFVAHRPFADKGWVVTDEGGEYGSEELISAHSHLNPTALVPIEAEEEKRSVARHPGGGQTNYNTEAAGNPGRMGEYIASLPVESRLVTRWEEA